MKINEIEEEAKTIFFLVDDKLEFDEITTNQLSGIKDKKVGKHTNMAVVILTNLEDFNRALEILSSLENKNKRR